MAIYEVEAPDGRILSIEGPDGANRDDVIAQAQKLYKPEEVSGLTKFGRSATSMLDLIPEGLASVAGIAAYPLEAYSNLKEQARTGDLVGRGPGTTPRMLDAAQAAKEQITGAFHNPFGRMFGVADTPQYRNMPVRQAVESVGETIGSGVNTVAEATGMNPGLAQQIADMGMLYAGPKIAKKTGEVTMAGARGAADIARQIPEGVTAGFTSAEPKFSSRVSPEILAAAKKDAGVGPVGDMIMAINDQSIPHRGKLTASTVENIVRGYKDNAKSYGGFQGIADLAGLLGMQVPLGSAIKGAQRGSQIFSPLRYEAEGSLPGMPNITNRSGTKSFAGLPRALTPEEAAAFNAGEWPPARATVTQEPAAQTPKQATPEPVAPVAPETTAPKQSISGSIVETIKQAYPDLAEAEIARMATATRAKSLIGEAKKQGLEMDTTTAKQLANVEITEALKQNRIQELRQRMEQESQQKVRDSEVAAKMKEQEVAQSRRDELAKINRELQQHQVQEAKNLFENAEKNGVELLQQLEINKDMAYKRSQGVERQQMQAYLARELGKKLPYYDAIAPFMQTMKPQDLVQLIKQSSTKDLDNFLAEHGAIDVTGKPTAMPQAAPVAPVAPSAPESLFKF